MTQRGCLRRSASNSPAQSAISYVCGTALDSLGIIECYAGKFDRGEQLQREAVALFTASGNDVNLRRALGMLGFLLFARGAYAEAREVCQNALTMSRAAGDRIA